MTSDSAAAPPASFRIGAALRARVLREEGEAE
jgi:hypothetical protein